MVLVMVWLNEQQTTETTAENSFRKRIFSEREIQWEILWTRKNFPQASGNGVSGRACGTVSIGNGDAVA